LALTSVRKGTALYGGVESPGPGGPERGVKSMGGLNPVRGETPLLLIRPPREKRGAEKILGPTRGGENSCLGRKPPPHIYGTRAGGRLFYKGPPAKRVGGKNPSTRGEEKPAAF